MSGRDQANVDLDLGVRVISTVEMLDRCVDRLVECSDRLPEGEMVGVEFIRNWVALDDQTKKEEFRQMLKRIDQNINRLDSVLAIGVYLSMITSLADGESEAEIEMSKDLFNYAFTKYGTKLVPKWKEEPPRIGFTKSEAFAEELITDPIQEDIFLRVLYLFPDDPQWNEKVGMMIKACGDYELITKLRFRLRSEDLTEKDKRGYEHLLRDILGYPELEAMYVSKGLLKSGEHLPLHLSLSEVYEAFDFENYDVSKKTEEFRMNSLRQLFTKHKVKKGSKIGDFGSGTGWLSGGLKSEGYDVVGLEIDPGNVKVANDLYPDVEFVQGSFQEADLLLEDESLDVGLVLGRSVTHLEDLLSLDASMAAMINTIKPGGLLLVDWPRPNVKGGLYDEYLSCLRNAYQRHGYSPEDLKGMNIIVDGPSTTSKMTTHLYTRLVPEIDFIKKRLADWGCELVEEVDEDLPNGSGVDRNVILVLRKLG